MAILELIRLKEIRVVQHHLFGDIEIVRHKEVSAPVEAAPTENLEAKSESAEPTATDALPAPEEGTIQDSNETQNG